MNIRLNPLSISELSAFASVRGQTAAGARSVYFLRAEGVSKEYLSEINELDRKLSSNIICYKRINEFPIIREADKIAFYGEKYNTYFKADSVFSEIKLLDCGSQPEIFEAVKEICELMKSFRTDFTETIEKNLVVNLLFFTQEICAEILQSSLPKKLVCSGKIGVKEYAFCLLCTYLGIDVLILAPSMPININSVLLEKSAVIRLGDFSQMQIPPYRKQTMELSANQHTDQNVRSSTSPVSLIHPNRASSDNIHSGRLSANTSQRLQTNQALRTNPNEEKSFEQLAQLAASVVLIAIIGQGDRVIGSGSGIAISRDGYILTNCHVASKGRIFDVRFENDDNVYRTSEIIKYHPDIDLAIIRINRELEPLGFFDGSRELVRGQKVVAIGSPLGMFNSVSDGIISGFRQIGDMDMIQFTAPISNGSSGGAVINMQGEVIGISTAGIDGGQNINLAVSYKQINPFISGFIG